MSAKDQNKVQVQKCFFSLTFIIVELRLCRVNIRNVYCENLMIWYVSRYISNDTIYCISVSKVIYCNFVRSDF